MMNAKTSRVARGSRRGAPVQKSRTLATDQRKETIDRSASAHSSSDAASDAVVAEGLRKSYGEVTALAGLDLSLPWGSVLSLLGPNGAGKTTVVRILTTLLRPDGGWAEVAGHDVANAPSSVRSIIGMVGQQAAVDNHLTGQENLILVGRLHHLRRKEAAKRADELLERFSLSHAADRPAVTYSGGMRRRLDLAAVLLGRPKVLFLDEPTAGLDPVSRLGLWEVLQQLVNDGSSLLLTTQYLEEADRLATTVAVIDRGLLIASGTPTELKSQVGRDVIEVVVEPRSRAGAVAQALAPLAMSEAKFEAESGRITIAVQGGSALLSKVVRVIDDARATISDLTLRRPTLDDAFLALTGSTLGVGQAASPEPSDKHNVKRCPVTGAPI